MYIMFLPFCRMPAICQSLFCHEQCWPKQYVPQNCIHEKFGNKQSWPKPKMPLRVCFLTFIAIFITGHTFLKH